MPLEDEPTDHGKHSESLKNPVDDEAYLIATLRIARRTPQDATAATIRQVEPWTDDWHE
jgi:hypothetical protein